MKFNQNYFEPNDSHKKSREYPMAGSSQDDSLKAVCVGGGWGGGLSCHIIEYRFKIMSKNTDHSLLHIYCFYWNKTYTILLPPTLHLQKKKRKKS